MERDTAFPNRAVEKLLREQTNMRVSKEAVQNLNEHLEDVAEDLADHAATAAQHADRKTIQGDDIELAVQ